MKTDEDGAPWVRVIDADTAWSDLQVIIEKRIALALDDVRAQIQGWDNVTEAERATALALVEPRIAPHIEAQTCSALVAGWFSTRKPIGETTQ